MIGWIRALLTLLGLLGSTPPPNETPEATGSGATRA
jgi:hypothetical protein